MRAAVLNTVPGRLDIEEVDVSAPGPREVLIRVAAAGLCHSDLHFMDGRFRAKLPAVLGHESAGVVEAVGDQVTSVQPGDHVITCLSVFCGSCEHCLSGRPTICSAAATTDRGAGDAPRLSRRGEPVHQFARMSSFAERMLVHEHGVVGIRPDMPLDRAALLGCGVTTGVGAVFRTARVEPGETVAVIGCGGIGLNAVQGARIAGAARIIAVDVVDTKLEMARTFGATDVVDGSGGDAAAVVRELTGGGVHHAFEAIGVTTAAEQAFEMLRPGGTATIIGMIPQGERIELSGAAFLGERRIQGSFMGSTRFRTDMPRLVDLYLDGRLMLDELISARIGLDDVNEGFEQMRSGRLARSVIVFD